MLSTITPRRLNSEPAGVATVRGRAVACRRAARAALAGLIVTATVLSVSASARAAEPVTETFGCTGTATTWTVPAGVTEAAFTVDGAQGTSGNVAGGHGGRTVATLPVTAADVYTITAGCNSGFNRRAGGFGYGRGGDGGDGGGNGGDDGNGGGGGSAVAGPENALLLVAGGGGGAAPNALGGAGGGSAGGPGGPLGTFQAAAGTGGTQDGPGTGGAGSRFGTAGGNGNGSGGGSGGDKASHLTGGDGGGGGGGGYFGGGGGGVDGGPGSGGGGSGFAAAGLDAELTSGVRAGSGQVTVTYMSSITAPPQLSGSDPVSPANDNTPLIQGRSEGSTVVRLYETADCSGTVAAEGTPAQLASPGLQPTVADDSITTFYAAAADSDDNVSDCSQSSVTYVEDSTAPDTSVTGGPTGPTKDSTPTFEFDSSEPGASFACSVDDGDFASCESPSTVATLADGDHLFRVRATDRAGNTGATAATSFTVDTVAPDTSITEGPTGPTKDSTPTFEFESSEPGSFACSVDDGDFASCASPSTVATLADGDHTFEVRATDRAGNTGATAATSFTVDATGPVLTCATPAPVFVLGGLGGSITATISDAGAGATATSVSAAAIVSSVGNKTVSLTGTDTLSNTTTIACPYRVAYRFGGFLSPISKSKYTAGSTIPVRFKLTNAAGTPISDTAARALLTSPCQVKVLFNNTPTCVTYDAASDTFRLDLKTAKTLTAGTYTITVQVSADPSGVVNSESVPINITR